MTRQTFDDLERWLLESFEQFLLDDPGVTSKTSCKIAAEYAMKRIKQLIAGEIIGGDTSLQSFPETNPQVSREKWLQRTIGKNELRQEQLERLNG